MADSSPARRSQLWSSPARTVVSDILSDEKDRNSEWRHAESIERAKLNADRLREACEKIVEIQHLKEAQNMVAEEKRREQERIATESKLAEERLRLLELKRQKVETPPSPPPPHSEPAPGSDSKKVASPAAPASSTPVSSPNGTPGASNAISSTPKPNGVAPSPLSAQPAVPSPLGQASQAEPAKPLFPSPSLGSGSSVPRPQPNGPVPAQQQAPPAAPVRAGPDRYVEIHKNLKMLREFMDQQMETNSALEGRMGDMRREIRKCCGQLTPGIGTNRKQLQSIQAVLREAMQNGVQSRMVDPSSYVVEPRSPVDGSAHNGELPSLFLYLLNIFSKAALAQFINEAGARPETADPVGVALATVFSDKDFQWRGSSLIDILIAKFRVLCPVLFGYNGNEKTEQGRARLGWWKEGGDWIPEQHHMDRMTGLGAGFASVALRKFKAASGKTNPYPPRNYWAAMSRIVNTPSDQVSSTQCVVLKSMIQNFEPRILDFYGNAGLAALRLALVDLPKRAVVQGAPVVSLEVLASVLKRDTGLDLNAL